MPVTYRQKRQIKEEAGFRCAVPTCNNTSPLEIHHIIDQAHGGTDGNDNLICLCANCHGRYHAGEIPRISIQNYKQRLQRISVVLFPHEYNYLESLNQGEPIQLDNPSINLARRLERFGYVEINAMGNGQFQVTITQEGTNFIN